MYLEVVEALEAGGTPCATRSTLTSVTSMLLPKFPIVVHGTLFVMVAARVERPFVLINRCGITAQETTKKDQQQYFKNLK